MSKLYNKFLAIGVIPQCINVLVQSDNVVTNSLCFIQMKGSLTSTVNTTNHKQKQFVNGTVYITVVVYNNVCMYKWFVCKNVYATVVFDHVYLTIG